MKKTIIVSLLLIPLLLLLLLIFKSQIYRVAFSKELYPVYAKELTDLASKSIQFKDVPISALVLFDNKIIGRGFNTVKRNSDAGGHAEINALSDAISSLGYDVFMALDREKLIVLSTFEPCPMCIGAIQVYNIKYTQFLKRKPLNYWLNSQIGSFIYEYRKRKTDGDWLQDSMFAKHPEYLKHLGISE